MSNQIGAAFVFVSMVALLTAAGACGGLAPPPRPVDDDGDGEDVGEDVDDVPPDEEPPTDDNVPPVVVPVDISTDGCNGARWCADLEAAQFATNVDLVACGESCSIHETSINVDGCLLTFSGAVGVALEGSYPSAYLSFGSVAVGESAEHVVRVENRGESDCPIDGVSVQQGGAPSFSIVDPAINVLAAGAFVDVAIAFAPTTARGLENPYFDVVIGGMHNIVLLFGVSTEIADAPCRLEVATGSVAFTAYVGSGAVQQINIASVGASACVLLPIEVAGESFAAVPAESPFVDPNGVPEISFVAYPSSLPLDVTDGALAPGEHVLLDVIFAARAEGATSGTLVIRAQGADDVAVTLSGTAFPPPPPCECDQNWGSDCTFNAQCS